jgi:hypothetical protein
MGAVMSVLLIIIVYLTWRVCRKTATRAPDEAETPSIVRQQQPLPDPPSERQRLLGRSRDGSTLGTIQEEVSSDDEREGSEASCGQRDRSVSVVSR